MTKPNHFLLIASTVLLLLGCQKSQTTKTNAPNSLSSGLFSSNVLLIDENDNFLIDNSGTTVTIENSNPLISVSTDNAGNFQLPKFTPTATIALIYSHPGFGTMKKYYTKDLFDSVANGIIGLGGPILAQKSTVIVNSLSGKFINDTLQLNCNVSTYNTSNFNAVCVFFQKNNPGVSYDNCVNFLNCSGAGLVHNGDNQLSFCPPNFTIAGFHTGDTIYI